MEVRMETTRGLGKEAQVWVDGVLLTVCDNVSPRGGRCPAGVVEDARFNYVTNEAFAWADAIAGNKGCRKRLDPVRGWSYAGLGQVVSVMPVVIDFGLLEMEDANWTTDGGLIGKYVSVAIDRLEIARAGEENAGIDARNGTGDP
jgi:hypothetical protein